MAADADAPRKDMFKTKKAASQKKEKRKKESRGREDEEPLPVINNPL